MNKKKLKDLYLSMKYDGKITEAAVHSVLTFENYLKNYNKTFKSVNIDGIKEYIKILIEKKKIQL